MRGSTLIRWIWNVIILFHDVRWIGTAGLFECPSRFGYFADRAECTKYYICNFGFGVQQECPNGLQFSTRLRNCDWIRNINCTQYPGFAYRQGEDSLPLPASVETTTADTDIYMLPLKNSRFPPIFAQAPQRTTTGRPELQVCPARPCNSSTCTAPRCRCGSSDIPNGMDPEDVPQMIIITFENAINEWTYSVYQSILREDRKNPNGCPIKATFFVSHEWTDYSSVQNLYSSGHEMAVLGVSLLYEGNRSEHSWEEEVAGQRKILSLFGNVSKADVHGMRAPYLTIGGDEQFSMLYRNDFTFDSSMPVFENEPPFFPFTLDCLINNYCMIDPCPKNSYPGIWELPVVMWSDLSGSRCNTVDGCTDSISAPEVFELLMSNFERHYSTNRAPFNMFMSPAWFAKEMNTKAFKKFVETMLSKKDVFFVTIDQVIQWMKNPTPLSQIKDFKPWQCHAAPPTPPCLNPNICTPWFEKAKEIRPLKTCMPCPKKYPWLGNEEGL
ncbi:hypothetical protein RvY_12650 [Ramazzottius varieornatus]|uniref:Chitin-binding type-2 domain-containing protein n=1 Tax=Ramazzottius varieornatus TaxID=947166 RepID=A0A1D1VK97_RAMVA|nr:hypothetical protein RvY_12650 [Ramazzottius varieornatus]